MNKFAIRVQNISTNIQKIPFKLGTPRKVMEKIDALLPQRKKRTILPDVSVYIDLARLDRLSKPPREVIKYTIKEIKEVVIIPKKKRGPKKGVVKKDIIDKKSAKKKNVAVEKEAK